MVAGPMQVSCKSVASGICHVKKWQRIDGDKKPPSLSMQSCMGFNLDHRILKQRVTPCLQSLEDALVARRASDIADLEAQRQELASIFGDEDDRLSQQEVGARTGAHIIENLHLPVPKNCGFCLWMLYACMFGYMLHSGSYIQ